MSVLETARRTFAPVLAAVIPSKVAPPRPKLSQDDCRAIVATAYGATRGRRFRTIRGIEYMPEDAFKSMAVKGTMLAVANQALVNAGVQTGDTVGGVMAAIGLSHDEMDDVICYCANGEYITGARAAANFQAKACTHNPWS